MGTKWRWQLGKQPNLETERPTGRASVEAQQGYGPLDAAMGLGGHRRKPVEPVKKSAPVYNLPDLHELYRKELAATPMTAAPRDPRQCGGVDYELFRQKLFGDSASFETNREADRYTNAQLKIMAQYADKFEPIRQSDLLAIRDFEDEGDTF